MMDSVYDFDTFDVPREIVKSNAFGKARTQVLFRFFPFFFSAIPLGFLSGPPVRHRKCLARPARHSDRNEVERA